MTAFNDLGLCKPILSALLAEGYTTPTPIQTQAIPLVLEGRDILGIAQTGTGKTAAFALPILQMLAENRKPAPRRGCRALVLSPTRELATQIAESFRAYGKNMGLTVAVVFGGVKYGPQVRALAAGVDVLVATPGRLIDHINEKVANLSETEVFVLDEADQMLDMGFVVPIRRIAKTLPQQRQNLFFSATMPTEIGKLAGELLKNPAKVSVTPQATTVEKIDQKILFIESGRKRALLAELMDDGAMKRVLIFTRTKRGADRVAKQLATIGVEAAAIHGDKSQGQRERSLAAFKAGDVRALVATDIAARGIDVEALSHVINFDVPNVPEDYIHRVGRTARAGAVGDAFTFCAPQEQADLNAIERAVGRRLDRRTVPGFDYQAKPAERFEVPIGERIAAIRARKAEERARAKAKAERKAQREAEEAARPAARGERRPQEQHRRAPAPAAQGEGSAPN
ncbi:MAG TPA: DEAD/DEAH box helicase, partial [Caulobacter sp.]|nr:DEAD/DEAH box helicase [Caulobacter sp.]